MAKSLIEVKNTGKVAGKFRAMSLAGVAKARLEVGYSAPHAARVHEDLEMNHPNGGQAKYLEAPLRRYSRDLGKMFAQEMKNKRSLKDALMRPGKWLLAKSRELVPVLTGELRDSGFVRVN